MSGLHPKVVGLYRIPLSQRRFKSGALYVSAIGDLDKLEAVDIRYFVEDDKRLIPTRQGFRVHSTDLGAFKKLLNTREKSIQEVELWKGTNRKLVANYRNDEYGTAVDVRYFSDSTKYKGWEPKGIRFQIQDFAKLRQTLLDSGLTDGRCIKRADLFEGKEIVSRPLQGGSGSRNGKAGVEANAATTGTTTINEALRAFIDGE